LTPNALGELSGKLEKAQEGLRSAVELGLDKLRTDNAEKLEQMRSTVDEKLQVTLETASDAVAGVVGIRVA
jgi:DNA recombination protein RmuC